MSIFGGDTNIPGPTEEELALIDSQTGLLDLGEDILSSDLEFSQVLQPLLLNELGFTPVFEEFEPTPNPSFSNLSPIDFFREYGFNVDNPAFDPNDPGLQNLYNLYQEGRLGELDANAARQFIERFGPGGTEEFLDEGGRRLTGFEPTQARLDQQEFQSRLQDLQEQILERTIEDLQPSTLDDLREQVDEATLQRQLDALQGNLPLPAALEDSLAEQEQQLRARLLRDLGPGFETSTPGIEALGEFSRNAEIIKDQARRGDITSLGNLSLAQETVGQQGFGQLLGGTGSTASLIPALQGSTLANLGGVSSMNLPFANVAANLAGGFGAAQQPFQFYGNQAFQASQQPTLMESLIGQAGGTAAGFGTLKLFGLV